MNGKEESLADVEAHNARARLAETLMELSRRRATLFDLRALLWRQPFWVPIAGGVLLVGMGAAAGAWVVHRKQAPKRRRRARKKAVARAWNHPERVANYAERSLSKALLRKGLWVFLAALVTQVAKEAVNRVPKFSELQPRTPTSNPRLPKTY